MTAKRFKKLMRARAAEFHAKYGVDVNDIFRLCRSKKPVLRNEPGANYQTAYDALSKVLQ